MEEKITVIEGPTPVFTITPGIWTYGLIEGDRHAEVVATRLRTFDGQALIDRCHHAWDNQKMIYLEFRTPDGLIDEVPILAARALETNEGEILLLWVRFSDESIDWEMDYSDDDDFFPDDLDDWNLDDLF